jgi:hypothetical protein
MKNKLALGSPKFNLILFFCLFPGNIERRLQPGGRIESGMPSGIVNRFKELIKRTIFNVKVTKLNVEFSVVLTTGLTGQ